MSEQTGTCVQSTLFLAGEAGYECFRIPAIVTARSGTILAFAEGRKDGRGDYSDVDLALKRSTDNGETWSDLRFIVDDGDHTMGNPCPIADGNTGAVHLLFCRDNKQVFVIKSNDDGLSWSSPVDVTSSTMDPRFYFVYTGPGHGVQLSSGRLVAPSACDYGKRIGDTQGSYIIYSDDGGRSWKIGGILEPDLTDECEVVELSDGRIYFSGRSRQGKRCRAYAHSSDGGMSWTPIAFDPQFPEPGCQGSIVRAAPAMPGGPYPVIMVHPSNIYGRAQLTLRVSYDDAATWPAHRVLYEGCAAYSDMAFAADSHILCLYEADDYTRIACARFTVEWLAQ